MIYEELSRVILNIAFTVHNTLGPGFSEDLYEKAFVRELEERNIPYEAQKVITIDYKGKPLGTYRLDLIVDGKVIVELKAVAQINDLFKQQLISYLKATGMPLGLLINFGARSVQHERVINTKRVSTDGTSYADKHDIGS